MKITGMNSADLISSLYEATTTGKDKDDDSIGSLLSANMSANNAALSGLSAKSSDTEYYKKTLNAAENAADILKTLSGTSTESGSIQSAKESGAQDTATVTSGIQSFVSAYNTMVSNMTDAGGKDNKNLLEQLSQYMSSGSSTLSGVGITQNEDGTLKVDTTALKGADLDTIASAFGADSQFASGLSKQVSSVADEASGTVKLLQIYSTAYSNSGSYSESSFLQSLYDIKA